MSLNPLAPSQLKTLDNFGHSLRGQAHVVHPTSAEEIAELFHFARKNGLKITPRGAGRSYSDASLNSGGLVLDLSKMDKTLAWFPQSGIITCQPGVTLQKLWQRVLPDGWWPPVVSGTMFTTLGGCLSMNVHGKNNFQMGPIGEHVLEFNVLLPTGAEITCSPKLNGDLFYSVISGMGMLGVFTSITLQMKKIHSGLLDVFAWPTGNLNEHLQSLQENAPHYDYIVGWLDALANGSSLGRSQIHAAKYIHEDPLASTNMQLNHQSLPSTFFGIIPKGLLHYFMTPFLINPAVALVNTAKYITSLRKHHFRQTHAGFHFLLDYVPNWERSFGGGGLIQYQSFVPKETAADAWREILTLSHKQGLPAYIGVTKRHRPDKFLFSHAVDGFSLALDFKVTDKNRQKMNTMLQEFDRIIVQAGGRFYFAKNSQTSPETAKQFLGEAAIQKFKRLKKRTDPHNLLESDLYRRVFGDA